MTSSPNTCTRRASRPLGEISPLQRMENGRRRGWTGRRSRTHNRTTSINSATAKRSRSCGRRSQRPETSSIRTPTHGRNKPGATLPSKERDMMNTTRRTLGTVAAALLAGLCWCSGASAQSGNPIKVGMSLALTGSGAPAGKMLQAAVELWRDDVNAKGGLLGRSVEIIVYDDQSNPASVPGLYTKLISVDKADLLPGPYGT